ncbi:uncharacterized protein LOC117188001 [Drosophila miranda]|uniref:uncharacterized protein LOC117188001 n=1 Tax=Drosophila miranda TaxID=7229 RepID=UPI0007E65F6B|nr:uncharacterized protein LOC117188001 [Drosophila miranda]
MNPKLNLISLTLIAELFLLVPFGNARSVSITPTQQKIENNRNSTRATRNGTLILDAGDQRLNSTSLSVSHVSVSASVSPSESSPSTVRHIRRKKREYAVDIPFDFFTNHMHCDMDQSGSYKIMDYFPFNCIWIQNNQHQHEGWWRIYMQAMMEAFFFGQYYERLRRFELDPHSFDYRGVGF